jgi:hypothetical protein
MWTALALVLAYGAVEGIYSHRWQASTALEEAAARLDSVPRNVEEAGEVWEGTDREMDARQQKKAEITSYLLRDYRNKLTGETVSVMLVCGRAGPISVHPPEVCYAGQGFVAVGKRQRITLPVGGGDVQLWESTFRKPDAAVPERLLIRYAWTAAGGWQAPDSARLKFAGLPALYKLYLIRQLPPESKDTKEPKEPASDPGERFLAVFLPQLQKYLFN